MNRYYPHTIIAQEGWTFIIGGAVVSLIIMLLCGWWSLPFWLATLFMLNFFRDPARNIPEAPDAILSPADGRVVVVEKAVDPYRNVETLKISIFMNVFDVHSQRAPARGKITDVRYTAGKKLNASLDKASSENERNAVLMTTASGREITFVQIAGLVARRILCYVNKGDSLVRGERYGFIRFGSRVDVYLPLDANPNVAIGDKVRATETILAFLPLEQDPNFDPRQVQIQSKNSVSPAARLKADKVEQVQRNQQQNTAPADDLDAQIRERVAAQFKQQDNATANPVSPSGNIAKEELEVAERLAKIQAERQAERQAEAAERERILAEERAEEEAVRQRIAKEKEEAEQAAKIAAAEQAKKAAEQARLQAEQAAKAEAERIAQEQARLQAEQAAKAEAERIAAEQAAAQERARIQAAQAAEQARIQAAEQAKAHAARLAEQARLQAEQAAKAEAERIAQEQARLQAEQAAKAEAERIAQEQARLQAEQAAKAEAERIAQEQARLQAEQAAKAEAERIAQEQARLQAEQAAKAEAERIAQEQARLRAEEEAEERARILAEEEAEAEAVRQRLAAEEQAEAAANRAHQAAEKFRQPQQQVQPETESKAQNNSFRQAEEKALAEIAAREPIVRRESFATVPEPWQTIEPSEVVIKVDDK